MFRMITSFSRMITSFSAEQIQKLRDEYAKLKTVNPSFLPRFHSLLGQCSNTALCQLGKAEIAFLSPLARNEMARRGIPEGPSGAALIAIPLIRGHDHKASNKGGTGLAKVAWIRNPGAPVGSPAPGRLNCRCGGAPETMFQKGPNIVCACGTVYTWDGWVVPQ